MKNKHINVRHLTFLLKNDIISNFYWNNPKPLLIIIFYRISSYFAQNYYAPVKLLGLPIRILYKLTIEWILGTEIPDATIIGKSLMIHHGYGIVINPKAILSNNITLRHSTTIGHKIDKISGALGAPIIHDNVDIGCNVVILGPIVIGKNTTIGAGSVIVKNIPENSIVVGNPAIIKPKLSL